MLTQQVADGVHFVEASHTNLAIVEDGDAFCVIDTGYPRDRRLLVAAIEEIGRSLSDCEALLVTHCHVDHTGSAEWLRKRAELDVLCHVDEASQMTGRIRQQISPAALLGRIFQPNIARFTWNAVSAGGLMRPNLKSVATFGDAETLAVPGAPAVVATPGHTSGHVSFHLPSRGVLITGDALCTINIWDEGDAGPQMIPAPFVHDWDQAVASLDRLGTLDAEVIVPGHGQPWTGSPSDAVAAARARLG